MALLIIAYTKEKKKEISNKLIISNKQIMIIHKQWVTWIYEKKLIIV